jgi:hypothetical protein
LLNRVLQHYSGTEEVYDTALFIIATARLAHKQINTLSAFYAPFGPLFVPPIPNTIKGFMGCLHLENEIARNPDKTGSHLLYWYNYRMENRASRPLAYRTTEGWLNFVYSF